MNQSLFQLSILMVSAGILWSLLGKHKIETATNSTPKKRWSIKGEESFALIVLGFVVMVVAMYI